MSSCGAPEGSSAYLKDVNVTSILPEYLWEEFEEIKEEQDQIDYLISEAKILYEENPLVALTLVEHAELLSRRQVSNSLLAESLYWKAFVMKESNPEDVELQRALADVKICVDIFEEDKQQLKLARALNLQADIHYSLREEEIGFRVSDRARTALLNVPKGAESYCEEWGNYYRVRAILHNVTGVRDSVPIYCNQAYQYYQECGDVKRQAVILGNLAYYHFDNYVLADSLIGAATSLLEENKYKIALRKTQLVYANMLNWRFFRNESLQWYRQSMEILQQLAADSLPIVSEVYYSLGVLHHNHTQIKPNTAQQHYDSLYYYYDLAINYSIEERNTAFLHLVEESVAGICDEIGSGRCLPLLSKCSEATQEIFRLTRVSFRESADEREQFKANESKERLYRSRTTFAIVLTLIAGIFFYMRQQTRVKALKEKLESRLETLRAQMNPHFISNSLNAIDTLVNKGETEKASEYIIDFSRLSRLILDNSVEKRIPLAKEIETLQYYLKLEKLRMRERLNYYFEIDDSLNLETIEIEPMLVQPFIENAILHGIQPKSSPGSIWIRISKNDSQQLEIRIKDDGVGRKKADEKKKKRPVDRISRGTKITEERLQGVNNYQGINIRYTDLYDKDGVACGTEVLVFYPIQYRKNL
ncbi:MAG: histidine kinase [Bacteroidota bacterium]